MFEVEECEMGVAVCNCELVCCGHLEAGRIVVGCNSMYEVVYMAGAAVTVCDCCVEQYKVFAGCVVVTGTGNDFDWCEAWTCKLA